MLKRKQRIVDSFKTLARTGQTMIITCDHCPTPQVVLHQHGTLYVGRCHKCGTEYIFAKDFCVD